MGRVNPTTRTTRRGVHAAGRAAGERAVGVAILTVSDTRRGEDDTSGATIERLVLRAKHDVTERAWVRDELRAIRAAARTLLSHAATDVVVVTGGTGLAPRDVTPEALEPLYERAIPGFGEAFRAASWGQVGAAAWCSRASAGVARGRLLVLLPGSRPAVTLAMKTLLLPELAHVVRLLGRTPSTRGTR